MNRVTAAEAKAGWRSLFDGKTFDGWTQLGELKWTIVDGAMVGDAVSQPAANPRPPGNNPTGSVESRVAGIYQGVVGLVKDAGKKKGAAHVA